MNQLPILPSIHPLDLRVNPYDTTHEPFAGCASQNAGRHRVDLAFAGGYWLRAPASPLG